jgi:hypothetical protein
MSKTRKSPYERLMETERRAQQAENEVAALKAQIRADERRKDTRRKVLDGAMSFAHARLDPEYREMHANMLHKVGAAMKTDRARAEAAELETWVRGGCPDVDIDKRIEEMAKAAAKTPLRQGSVPSAKPDSRAPKS